MKAKMFIILVCIRLPGLVPVAGQDAGSSAGPEFGLAFGLGVHGFPTSGGTVENYQFVSLSPEFTIGKIGIGLLVPFHYRFTSNPSSMMEIRAEDWYRPAFFETVSLYASKLQYARYGEKGDPVFVKLGSVNDGTLGNGFIFGGYSNMARFPGDRYLGMRLDLDASLFNFPYVGTEAVVGDLFSFDVAGTRLYVRPLRAFGIPVFGELQVGGTIAMDRIPFRFSPEQGTDSGVVVLGLDYRLPLLSSPAFSLIQFADFVAQRSAFGGMAGVGGMIHGFIPYGLQIRFLGENFIPAYFDGTYDSYRVIKYHAYRGDIWIPSNVGWLFSSGLELFESKLSLSVAIDGMFIPVSVPAGSAVDPRSITAPHLTVTFFMKEGFLPDLFFSASYDKKGISSFNDLFNPSNAVIHADVNYRTGPALISLYYDVKYNPLRTGPSPWDVTSGLETMISLFRAED